MGPRKQRFSSSSGEHRNDGAAGTPSRPKKTQVAEINGVLWQLDDYGSPVKKVKRKAKPDPESPAPHEAFGSGGAEKKKKSKPSVREIDGVLWQIDEGGLPVKKVRRKGAPRQDPEPLSERQQMEARRRSKSQGPAVERGRRQTLIPADKRDNRRLRARSVDGPLQQPGEYIDGKGRRVIIEEDGNKIVFDKNGKRLRPKKRNTLNGVATPLPGMNHRPFPDSDHDFMSPSGGDDGIFDDVWGDKSPDRSRKTVSVSPPQPQRNASPQRKLYQGMSAPPLDDDPSEITLSHRLILSSTEENSVMRDAKINETKTDNDTSELTKQIEEYGRENRELKLQLMAAQDEVRNLTQQNQKEKAKNVKATTDMLQLKADHQQASDDKRNLDLIIKNLEARLQEMEDELAKIESTPMNRRISVNVGGNGSRRGKFVGEGGKEDHLITQISDLMAENDALLDKLEFEKASSGHELRKKEERILFLTEEVNKLRADNDWLFRGEAEKDPLMARLLSSKKELEEKLEREKEVAKIRIDGMQETIQSLQDANATLRKDLEKATLEIKEEDDEEIRRAKEMAQAVAQHGTRNAVRAKRASIQNSAGTQEASPTQKAFSGFGLNKLTALAAAAGRK